MVSIILYCSSLVLVSIGVLILYRIRRKADADDKEKYKTARLVAYILGLMGLACSIANLFF